MNDKRKADARARFPEIAAAVDFLRAKGWKVQAFAAINNQGEELGKVDDELREANRKRLAS